MVLGLRGKILVAAEGAGVGISELFRLEKPLETIESNCSPSIANPPPTHVPYTHVYLSLCVHLYHLYINP